MPLRSVGFSLDLAPLESLKKELIPATMRAIENTLDEVKEIAQDLADQITGSMAAGTYIATHEKSGYQKAVTAAKALNPDAKILPEAPQPIANEGVLSNVTEQSIFEEFGTVKRGPHPFMTPAAMQGEQIFQDQLENEVKKVLPR